MQRMSVAEGPARGSDCKSARHEHLEALQTRAWPRNGRVQPLIADHSWNVSDVPTPTSFSSDEEFNPLRDFGKWTNVRHPQAAYCIYREAYSSSSPSETPQLSLTKPCGDRHPIFAI